MESGLGLTRIEHGVAVGLGIGVGLGVSVTTLFENPVQRPDISSYCQSSSSPAGCTAMARAALPFVRYMAGKGLSALGLVFEDAAGSEEESSRPSAVKLKDVVGTPNGIKGNGESCEAELAMRHPVGI